MKQSKRGFTIVELVIVIAVIAVLAAVLIPTFSSLIKKANLSADMQAVREMNIALAADEALNGKPTDVDTVMQVLANAGYNTNNWQCLTKDYAVYWYKKDNRMVLYSTKESKLVYPTEYDPSLFLNQKSEFMEYNQNVKNALIMDTNISSSTTDGKSTEELINSSSSSSEKTAIQSVNSAVSGNAAIASSLGLDGTGVYITANRELRSNENSDNYAAMQIMQVNDTNEVVKTSSGDVVSNVFFISVNTSSTATATEITAAKKAASEFVYTVFTQINSDKIDDTNGVSIIMPAGTEIDASEHEWKPVRTFKGYFGTDDAEHPIVINGAKLSTATGYLDTVYFDGSNGSYFVTGFFGTVYGESTIENLVFRNLSMNEPGSNYDMNKTTMQHSRNSIGVIGGVIDDPATGTAGSSVTDVKVRNIVVENNVTIKGAATAAGLIGYVGASGNKDVVNKASVDRRLFNGQLLVENCTVSATIEGGPETGTYGPCGGLIGFACRVQESSTGADSDGIAGERFQIIIKDCTFNGTVKGYQGVGAAVGDLQSGAMVVFQGSNNFNGSTLTAMSDNSDMMGLIGSSNAKTAVVVYFTTGEILKPADMAAIGRIDGGVYNTIETNIDNRTAAKKFDTLKDENGNNIGGNNGKIA